MKKTAFLLAIPAFLAVSGSAFAADQSPEPPAQEETEGISDSQGLQDPIVKRLDTIVVTATRTEKELRYVRVAMINDGQSFTIIDGPKRKAKRLAMGR